MADQKPVMEEVASIERDPFKFYFAKTLRNEDDTLLTRGGSKGLKIYDELARDCEAGALIDKRVRAVVSRPWVVTPASDKRVDKKAAEMVTAAFEALKFNRICRDLLNATLKGFSVGEVMWEVRNGLVLPRDVLRRNQNRFLFNMQNELMLITRTNMLEGEALPPRKFIVHRYGDTESPYGLGIGNRLFWPVFFKRQDITFWLTFADKFGSPTAVGKYPTGATPDQRERLLLALQAIAQDAGITVPVGMEVSLLEAATTSTDTYEKLARYMDEQMSKAVLGETMSTSAAAAGLGSSQADVHDDVRLEVAQADAEALNETLKDTLVTWMVEYNLPGAAVPNIERNFKKPEDKEALARRDQSLVQMGLEPDDDYIAETYPGWQRKEPAEEVPFDVITAPNEAAGGPDEDGGEQQFAEGAPLQKASGQRAFNKARQQQLTDGADALAEGWRQMVGPRVKSLMSMLDDTGDLVAFRERMSELLDAKPDDVTVDAIARANFASHIMGRGKVPTKSVSQKLLGLVKRRQGS